MRNGADTLGLSTTSTQLLRDLIHDRLGLFYEDSRLTQLADRVAPLVVQRGFASLLDYYYLLKYDPAGDAEWPRLMDALAVNETYFWREIDQLRAVVDVVLPEVVNAVRGPIRIWSIPCASGEEPLTIAMMLEDAGWFDRADIRIVGSDASPAAIEKARQGRYRERSFRNLPLQLRDKYFTKVGDEWQISPVIHRRVTWDVVNLLDQVEMARWIDSPIVFCRNVFIYFSERSIRRVVDLLAAQTPASRYLCVGASESLLRLTTAFELREVGGAFMYLRSAAADTAAEMARLDTRP